MEIINEIQKIWLSEEASIKNNILKFQSEHDENTQTIEELQSTVYSMVSDNKDESELINDIYDFMDYIGVSREKLPFKAEELDRATITEIENQLNEICKQDKVTMERIGMYKLYLEIIKSQRIGGGDIHKLRAEMKRYRSDYELYIDAFLLNAKALSLVKNSRYSEYEYSAYTDALSVFSEEEMKALGHPSGDSVWKDGTANLVVAVCRVSWEYYYLCKLAEKIEYYKLIKDKRGLKQIKKSEGWNPVISAWRRDTSEIEDSTQKDSVFYKIYKNIITYKVENDIDYFINKI